MCVSWTLWILTDRAMTASLELVPPSCMKQKNSERGQSMAETNQDKADSAQCRKVLSWDEAAATGLKPLGRVHLS